METPSKDTVGEVFISGQGDIYRQIAYCDSPTVCIENVVTGERQTHVVDCLNIKGMKLEQACDMKHSNLYDLVKRLANYSASRVFKD